MDTMKMRNISKMLLMISLLLMMVALVITVFAPWYIVVAIAVLAVLLVIAFIVCTLVYWRCPRCRLRFKMYDVELEQSRVCPRCGVRFDDPEACRVEYVPQDGEEDSIAEADDDDDEE